MKTLPDAEEVDYIARAHPVLDDEARVIGVTILCNVGERDVLVFEILCIDGYFQPFSMKSVFLDCHVFFAMFVV